MIADRYGHAQISSVWSVQSKLQRWVLVEAAIATAGGYDELAKELSSFEVDNNFIQIMQNMETQTQHEVTAFLLALEHWFINNPQIRYLHYGATSSDLMDTALAIAVGYAHGIISVEAHRLYQSLRNMWANAAQDGTKRLARTHGRVVYPVEAKHALLALVDELLRSMTSLIARVPKIPGRISGPVGDHPILTIRAERQGLATLGLLTDSSGTQLSPRDRLIDWLHALTRLVTTIEKIATLVRFEAIEGVDGIEQRVTEAYTGSSAMPHKINPTRAERLCGLATLVRANIRAVEDVSVPWGDNSLEHSSVERVVLPMVTELAGFMCVEMNHILRQIVWRNQALQGPRDSFRQLHELIDTGSLDTRSKAYDVIKESARG